MEKRNFSVYKHTFPNKKVYIGITGLKPQYRWNSGKGYKNQLVINRAIQKYGWNNIEHEIMFENFTKEEARLMEKMYIALYDSANPQYGYNRDLGGDVPTDEARKKIGEWSKSLWKDEKYREEHIAKLKAVWNKPGYRQHMSDAHKGQIHSEKHRNISREMCKKRWQQDEEYRNKMINIHKGRKNSSETKLKMSESRKIYLSNNPDALENATKAKYKKVICLNTKQVFNSIKEAGEWTKVKTAKSNIGACCKGTRKYCGKHPITGEKLEWMFYEEYLELQTKRTC